MAHSKVQTTTVCMADPHGNAGGRGASGSAGASAALPQTLDMRFGESVADALARLYKSPVAAIQEIVANGVAACKAARELHGADAYIRIHACGRNLSIEDRNSMGMTWAVFRDVYARAGSSLKRGSNGATTPGLFGCGSLSYVLVSDIMFLATHSRETGERYEVMACDGRGFQTGLPEPAMTWYGTRVRLTIREDVDMADIFDRIAEISAMCGVRIVVDMDGADTGAVEGPEWQYRRPDAEEAAAAAEAGEEREEPPPGTAAHRGDGATGRYVFKAATFDDEVQRMLGTFGNRWMEAGELVCVRGETEDLEVAAINRCNGGLYRAGDGNQNCTWLAGMPIRHKYNPSAGRRRDGGCMFGVAGWIVLVHAKNERKYMPTPDRERFPKETFGGLVDDVTRLLTEQVGRIRPATLAEYLSDRANRALEPCATYRTEPARGEGSRTRRALNAPLHHLNCEVDKKSLLMARAAGPVSTVAKSAGTSLWSLLYSGVPLDGRIEEPRLVVCERPSASLRAAIIEHHKASGESGRIVVFSPHPRNTLSVDDYVELGCESAAEYAKRNGLCKKPAAKRRKGPAKGARRAGGKGRGSGDSQPARSVPTKAEYVVHYGARGTGGKAGVYVPILTTSRVDAWSAPSGMSPVVRCNDSESFAAMQGALAALECDAVCATREQAGVRGAVDFDDYAAAAGDETYETTMGSASGRDLAGCGRRIVLVVYDRPPEMAADLASLIAGSGRGDAAGGSGSGDIVYVMGTARRLAGCAAHLWRSNAKFGVWMLPWYSRIRDDVLAGKLYLAYVAEYKHSPARSAPGWARSTIDWMHPEYERDMRTDAMVLLHAALKGEALLRGAGIEYKGGAYYDDEDEDEEDEEGGD